MALVAVWNSLEIAKLGVGILTPLAIFALGVWGAREARLWEQRQWEARKWYERRLDVLDEVGPLLNDLFCFFRLVGDFQKTDPPRAIEIKREVDRLFFPNAHLFSARFTAAYFDFISACYQHYAGGAASDAKLRSSANLQKSERSHWKTEWEHLFVSNADDVTPLTDIDKKYGELVDSFRE